MGTRRVAARAVLHYIPHPAVSSVASHFSLERSLAHSSTDVDELAARIEQSPRADLAALPTGALAFLLARVQRSARAPVLVLAADGARAARMASALRFCLGEREDAHSRVLVFPGQETTPFVDVAPDRRAAMHRLAVLYHLAHELPVAFVVAAVSALCRRVPPRDAIRSRCLQLRVGQRVAREVLLRVLTEGGYLRVPLVEDPGTFAVRGGLLDVFPPHERAPVRIELDDDVVTELRSFDPEDQRTSDPVAELALHPVRDTLLGPAERDRARAQLTELCDSLNMPSSKRRQLVDELEAGRLLLGIEGLLPAFYPRLQTLFDYLPAGTRLCALDPTALGRAFHDELGQAQLDHQARAQAKAPVYPIDALYLTHDELEEQLSQKPTLAVHALAIAGEDAQQARSPFTELERVTQGGVLELSAQDHGGLVAELRARRALRTAAEPLAPLVAYVERLREQGLRTVLTAKSATQAERLAQLLRRYGLPLGKPELLAAGALERPGGAELRVVIGPLDDGFVLPTEALAVLTEREVFGERSTRRDGGRGRKPKARAFALDLRELRVGDYVVHAEHGIGRYLGLDYKEVPVSRLEQLQGLLPRRVEVLVLEYDSGDKLYLPVTRLSQVEKLAGAEGATPKLDRLGGQTFERTRARVKREVKKLADDLLALYAERRARTRPPYPPPDRAYAELEATFPFEETEDQARAIEEVMSDLDRPVPADRVVCGDVGFGKTEVAMRAAFRVAASGRQVAVLCPTTVLAQQHFSTFGERMRCYPFRIEMLSRFVEKKEQTRVLSAVKEGKCDILIGTHRLLSKDVRFANLGLLVVDEEQRFGVTHKERVKQLKREVDVLTLSATPIPRTLQMAISGLRELSIIATPPSDRRAIRTIVTRWDDHVIHDAIRREISRGGQVFFVHNRIERLHERAAQLAGLVPDARIAVAHGRMREGSLERVMTDFVEGRYDVLCSTAIVENGLDIPRANTILIDHADRFGLSQLYQLRGRVGRARERAYCYLIAPPASDLSDEARTRIEALTRLSQLGAGFQVASLDMELRGAGDLLGAEQSGNVAAVGLSLFVQMLEEAVAELRGEPLVHDIDPELTLDLEHYLPDDYVADVGLRLSLYKRFASAEDEDAVADLAAEMEDRFGRPPAPALSFVRAMALKPALRKLRVLGCEASQSRVTFHLESDSPLSPARLVSLIAGNKAYQLTPDLRLSRRFPPDRDADATARIRAMLGELAPLEEA